MGSFGRKVKRNALKKQYKKFAHAWAGEKAYQEFVLKEKGELAEGTPRLKQKPTFAQWRELQECVRKKTRLAAKKEETKATEEMDLSWDEEENDTAQ